ncbi:uncharacterized protein LOC107044822 [Diachasma alloeum]|uniref:uncharacterized protein LOC107044822 n=1 Tax=Diachasma alloeum TaxID=454923 RepID=UPI0007382C0A|nr:uncharacterized protein LOC107044822 [Diachasma alloeum]
MTLNRDAKKKKPEGKFSMRNSLETRRSQKIVNPGEIAFSKLEQTGDNSHLERKPSLRKKLGAFMRGSADLPAAINRGLQPIRRSLSFSNSLNRSHEKKPHRARSAQWYNSLGSLAEDDTKDEDTERESVYEEELVFAQNPVIVRAMSFVENPSETAARRRTRPNVESPYGRHSVHYESSIDFSTPPFEACSLPALTHSAIDEDETDSTRAYRREKRGWREWSILRASARNSLLRLGTSTSKQRPHCSVSNDNEHPVVEM